MNFSSKKDFSHFKIYEQLFKYVKLNRLNIKQKNEYLIHNTSSERAFEDTAVNHTLPSLHENT